MRRVSVATGAVCASFRIVGLAILAILLTLGLSIPQAEASRRKQQKATSKPKQKHYVNAHKYLHLNCNDRNC
jgi:hypothetical protein